MITAIFLAANRAAAQHRPGRPADSYFKSVVGLSESKSLILPAPHAARKFATFS